MRAHALVQLMCQNRMCQVCDIACCTDTCPQVGMWAFAGIGLYQRKPLKVKQVRGPCMSSKPVSH